MKLKLCEVYNQAEFFDKNGITNDKIKEILEDKKNVRDYAFICHNKDKNTKPHYHIAIRFNNAQELKYVADWFGVPENMVNKVKGSWSDMLKYLTHQNAPEKYQYSEDEVFSNYEWKKDKKEKSIRVDERKEEIINNIVNMVYREYNIHQYITAVEFDKYNRAIENAYKYRDNILRNKEERNMEVIFITGTSGSGKTSYAKYMCKEKGYSYFVSGSSNDPLDGYQGQDVIVLDDLRGSCFAFADLLKMLDNNTNSSVKSRYRNKVLQCKMIIITSICSIEEFYKNVFESSNEPILQFKRRCKLYIKMTDYDMSIRKFNRNLQDYGKEIIVPNPILSKYAVKEETDEEELENICSMLPGVDTYIEENKEEILKIMKSQSHLDSDLTPYDESDLPF